MHRPGNNDRWRGGLHDRLRNGTKDHLIRRQRSRRRMIGPMDIQHRPLRSQRQSARRGHQLRNPRSLGGRGGHARWRVDAQGRTSAEIHRRDRGSTRSGQRRRGRTKALRQRRTRRKAARHIEEVAKKSGNEFSPLRSDKVKQTTPRVAQKARNVGIGNRIDTKRGSCRLKLTLKRDQKSGERHMRPSDDIPIAN